jgi:2-oxo-3-hexenedioate decarboxylase/2-keto-4-pentenoate hydratase
MSQTDRDPRLTRAAGMIAAARLAHQRLAPLPDDCRPRDEDEGYAVQEVLHEELAAAGRGEVIGYKIGCSTKLMQDWLGVDHPCAGGILASAAHRDGAVLRHGDYVKIGYEVEIAIRLGSDLPAHRAPFDRAQVADAVGACMASLEVIDARSGDAETMGIPTLIADDFSGAGCVLGAPMLDWQALDLAAVEGRAEIDGVEQGRGRGDEIMGHPLEALVWLANHLAGRGRNLRHGEVVLTGSLVYLGDVEPGQTVRGIIDGLGEVSATLA